MWVRSVVACIKYQSRRVVMGKACSRCVHSDSTHPPLGDLGKLAAKIRAGEIRNITVMAGAGISTASGIPDFRSPGTGLYDNLQKYELPYPEAIFELGYFFRRPEAFFQLALELYPSGKYHPNAGHYFPVLLQQKQLLKRMYTQNIDGLERIAGVEDGRLVEAHGTFHSATCKTCGEKYRGEDIKSAIFAGEVPRCHKSGCQGIVKPDIVFFGEPLPERFFASAEDMITTDLLLVMGTSLEVYPFAGLAEAVREWVPRVLFNRTVAGSFGERENDIIVSGDIVAEIEKFCNLLGWAEDLKALMDNNQDNYVNT